MYTQMKKNKILKSLEVVNGLSEKFPLMKLNQVNFHELGKFYKVEEKDLLTTVAFLDCLKELNRNSDHSYYIDIHNIERIKVNRIGSEWTFHIYRNKTEKVTIQHLFII